MGKAKTLKSKTICGRKRIRSYRKGDRVKVLYSGKYLSAVVRSLSRRGGVSRLHLKYSNDGSFETIEKDDNIADRVMMDRDSKKKRNSVTTLKSSQAMKKKKTTTSNQPKKLKKSRKKLTLYKHVGREAIGHRVRVYWDIDDMWVFGRIERYKVDTNTGRELHQVVYLDGDVEWLCLSDVRCYYSNTVAWAKLGRYPTCPAEIFEVMSAFEEDQKKADRNQCFVYFWNPGKRGGRSFAWVGNKNIESLDDVKPNKKYTSVYNLARAEEQTRMSIYVTSLRGPDLVGYKMSFRYDHIFPMQSQKKNKYIRGTVTSYDAIEGLNFVVFQDIDLIPRWIDLSTIKPEKIFTEKISQKKTQKKCCDLCFRSATCYQKRTTATGRSVVRGDGDNEDMMLTCVSCLKSFHQICCSSSSSTLVETNVSSTPRTMILCHECIRCDGCNHKSLDLKCEFSRNHKFSLPEILESELSTFLPSIPKLNLCVKCVKAFDSAEYCANCYKSWGYDERDFQDNNNNSLEYRRCESQMVECDHCAQWSHAKCDPCLVTLEDYQNLMKKDSKYICPLCRYAEFSRTLKKLFEADYNGMFQVEVTEEIAPGYFSVVDCPMNLKRMRDKVKSMT